MALNVDYEQMNKSSVQSIKNHLIRQFTYQQSKMESVEELNRMIGSGKNWKNKVTSPITPRTLKTSRNIRGPSGAMTSRPQQTQVQ